MTRSTTPDTIVLIHGLWVTPRSWENWVTHYQSKGYRVITPAYPGFEIEVEELRHNPDVIATLTVPETVDHLAGIIEDLPAPPIIMGHSFGGIMTQLLVDRGLGAAAVVIDSAPTEGVRAQPPSQARALLPILKRFSNRHKAAGFTEKQFHYAFTNTLDDASAQAAYDRYAIAAPGSWVWKYGVFANWTPGHQETWVNYTRDERAPLLFIAGGADNIMPPAVNKSNARKYRKSAAVTDYYEFPGRSHWTCAEPGWEAVADYALDWAIARTSDRTAVPHQPN